MHDAQAAKNEILESGYFRIDEINPTQWGDETGYPALLLIIHMIQSGLHEATGSISDLHWYQATYFSDVIDGIKGLGLLKNDEVVSLFVNGERYIILIER